MFKEFSREKYYGIDLCWYGVDAKGELAQFVTGFGPVPSALFADPLLYERVLCYFDELGGAAGHVVDWYRAKAVGEGLDLSGVLEDVAKGVYVIDEQGYGPFHRVLARPLIPLRLEILPDWLSEFLVPFVFSRLVFSEADAVDIRDHIVCAV